MKLAGIIKKCVILAGLLVVLFAGAVQAQDNTVAYMGTGRNFLGMPYYEYVAKVIGLPVNLGGPNNPALATR